MVASNNLKVFISGLHRAYKQAKCKNRAFIIEFVSTALTQLHSRGPHGVKAKASNFLGHFR